MVKWIQPGGGGGKGEGELMQLVAGTDLVMNLYSNRWRLFLTCLRLRTLKQSNRIPTERDS